MRLHSSLLATLLTCAPLWPASIPATRATTLSGQLLDLPADFKASLNLLIVGFSQRSGEQIQHLVIQLKKPLAEKAVPFFILPNLAGAPALIRGLIVRGMRSETPRPEWDRFAPVFENEKKWKQTAGFDEPDDAYFILVDEKGGVLWSAHRGPVDDLVRRTLAELDKHR